ncbi:MAG: hypothetical protein ACPL1F_08255, partial [bacterium]
MILVNKQKNQIKDQNIIPKLNYFYDVFTFEDLNSYNKKISEFNSSLNQLTQKKKIKFKLANCFKKIQIYEKIKVNRIENDEQLIEEINSVCYLAELLIKKNPYTLIIQLLKNKSLVDIYLNRKLINEFSKKIFNQYNLIYKEINLKKTNDALKEGFKNFVDVYSCIKNYQKESEFIYFLNEKEKEIEKQRNKVKDCIKFLKEIKSDFKNYELEQNLRIINNLKKEFSNFFPKILFNDKELNKSVLENIFYENFTEIFDEDLFENFNNSYNLIRNYVTKKPEKKDKININFNNSSFLTGWARSKIYDYGAFIITQEINNSFNYYLVVII